MRMLVLGAGLQGAACAYDLLQQPGVTAVTLADSDFAKSPPVLDHCRKDPRLTLLTLDARDHAAVRKAMDDVRWHIAFYGSTRSYHGVWEMHGWLDTGLKLHELSVTNGWDRMPALVTDEMVRTFAAVGTYEEIGDRVLERFGGFATRAYIESQWAKYEPMS